MAGSKGKLASNKKEQKKVYGMMVKLMNWSGVSHHCSTCDNKLPDKGMAVRWPVDSKNLGSGNLYCNYACAETAATADNNV